MTEHKETSLSSTEEFELLLAGAATSSTSKYVLRLYVSGMTPRSTEAINNLTTICDEYLKGRCELEVIDIYKHPERTGADQIVATPTLVKKLPLPLRRLLATLSDEERVLVGLDLVKEG